jgi:hypothetical protein
VTPVEAWSAVVSGEDAAIYAYSVAGGRVPAGARRRALAGLDAHRANRSRAAAEVSAAGGTPPPAAAGYVLPADIERSKVARAAMAAVDNALVATYADAAAASGGALRRWAARAAADCAVRAVTWGAPTQAFPSAPVSAE